MSDFGGPLVAIIGAILAALVFFFKGKADKAGAEAVMADTKGQDKQLVEKQSENQTKLDSINKDIQDLKDEKAKLRDQYLTDAQRAEQWNKK